MSDKLVSLSGSRSCAYLSQRQAHQLVGQCAARFSLFQGVARGMNDSSDIDKADGTFGCADAFGFFALQPGMRLGRGNSVRWMIFFAAGGEFGGCGEDAIIRALSRQDQGIHLQLEVATLKEVPKFSVDVRG